MKNISKRFLSALLAVLMVTALFAAMPVTASADEDEFSAKPSGVNLTLDSEILLNIYFNKLQFLPRVAETNVANSGYVFKIEFLNQTIKDADSSVTLPTYEMSLDDYFNGTKTATFTNNLIDYNDGEISTEKGYKITCPISVEYYNGGSVKFGVYDSTNTLIPDTEKTFYFDSYGKNSSGEYVSVIKEKEQTLIESLQKYSEYAQYFKFNDALDDDFEEISMKDWSSIYNNINLEHENLAIDPFDNLNLALDSNIMMNITSLDNIVINAAEHINDSNNAIICNTRHTNNGITIEKIPAHAIRHKFTINYTLDTGETGSVTCSPLDYIYSVVNTLNIDDDNPKLFDLCLMLYEYGVAADDYIENA